MFTALIEYLTGLSALTAVVPAASIQPIVIRKGTNKPYITVSRVARTDSQDLGGGSTYSEVDTFEIDVVTDSATEGEQVREIIRKKLDGYQQSNMGTTSPFYIGSTRIRNVFDYYESDANALDAYSYHSSTVVDFGYSQVDSDV
jgi:hypothetical protein